MDRKTIYALLLSVGLGAFWVFYIMIPTEREEARARAEAALHAPDGGDRSDDKTTPKADKPDKDDKDDKDEAPAKKADADAPKADAKPDAKADAKPAPLARQPETFTTIEVPGYLRATLSSWGAALHDVTLADPRFVEKSGDHDMPIDLVPVKDPPLPFAVSFVKDGSEPGLELPADADFKLESSAGNERRYSFDGNGVHIERRWTFVPGTYEAQLAVIVENRGDKPLPASMRISVTGRQDPDNQPSFLRTSVIQTEGLCSTGDVERAPLDKLLKSKIDQAGPVRLIAIDRKYFVVAAAMEPVPNTLCRIEGSKGGRISVRATQPPVSIEPGKKHEWNFSAFIGPKVLAELDAVKVITAQGPIDARLKDVINNGFFGRVTEFFSRLMFVVLKASHRVIGNWGVAIILLTILIKLITWYPTAQSMKSAQAMGKLKPEMDKLKEKYGDDKQRMNQEMMALYQKHKINPLGGCLPVLIQMPIYIALYSMLGNSVELYRANFGLWIHDLTGPDPYFVLPLLTGGLMFLQQKLSPAAVDPQQKTMMTMMPLMFTGMSMLLPAGLTLYILTNTGLSIVQQRMSNRQAAAATPSAPAESKKKKNK
jgi:YidC/Oxa1 family membrane protein insertase